MAFIVIDKHVVGVIVGNVHCATTIVIIHTIIITTMGEGCAGGGGGDGNLTLIGGVVVIATNTVGRAGFSPLDYFSTINQSSSVALSFCDLLLLVAR